MKCLAIILALAMVHGMTFGAETSTPSNTPVGKITIRIRQQNIQIQRDEKAGKLTKAQAKSLKAKVEAIRQQEIAFIKQSGTKTLTAAQFVQLNEQLNTLSKTIPIK